MVEKFDCDLAMQIAKHLAARGAGKPVGDIGPLCADASQMLLQAVCLISTQDQEKSLPDSSGWWWNQTHPDIKKWKVNYVRDMGSKCFGVMFTWFSEGKAGYKTEPAMPGRWIKVAEPV